MWIKMKLVTNKTLEQRMLFEPDTHISSKHWKHLINFEIWAYEQETVCLLKIETLAISIFYSESDKEIEIDTSAV